MVHFFSLSAVKTAQVHFNLPWATCLYCICSPAQILPLQVITKLVLPLSMSLFLPLSNPWWDNISLARPRRWWPWLRQINRRSDSLLLMSEGLDQSSFIVPQKSVIFLSCNSSSSHYATACDCFTLICQAFQEMGDAYLALWFMEHVSSQGNLYPMKILRES